MARVYPLFSSSEGNSYFVGSRHGGILVDAGVSCKRLVCALEDNGIPVSAVQGVFITHEHKDHINALKTLTNKYRLAVFAQPLNAEYLRVTQQISPKSMLYDICGDTQVGDFLVSPFITSHDTRQSCGYKIHTPDDKIICICTDLGKVTEIVHENLMQADLVVLEANYDYDMLLNGPYPYQLKQRILSDKGHLDNCDCGNELKKLVENKTTRIILGHLSKHNNTPATAERTVLSRMSGLVRNTDFIMLTAPVQTNGEVMVV